MTYETALDIKSALLDKGFPEGRLHVIGWGKNKPKLPNINEAARELNKRIEIFYYVP